jgi:hypothetical protein
MAGAAPAHQHHDHASTTSSSIARRSTPDQHDEGSISTITTSRRIANMVFLGSSCRETAKNAIKKPKGKDDRKKVFFFSTFSVNFFLTWTSPKKFLMAKRTKSKNASGKKKMNKLI